MNKLRRIKLQYAQAEKDKTATWAIDKDKTATWAKLRRIKLQQEQVEKAKVATWANWEKIKVQHGLNIVLFLLPIAQEKKDMASGLFHWLCKTQENSCYVHVLFFLSQTLHAAHTKQVPMLLDIFLWTCSSLRWAKQSVHCILVTKVGNSSSDGSRQVPPQNWLPRLSLKLGTVKTSPA